MQKLKKLGFPRMRKESGERRVFLPDFIQDLTQLGFEIYIEEGYGSRSGYSFDDYKQGNPLVKSCSREQAHAQAYVMVLRSPSDAEFDLIPAGTCLISMLHYPTRPERVDLLTRKGIKAISMDSIVDDNNIRLMENMKAVAWNGLEVGFDALERRWPGLLRADPWKVLVLGSGMVGKHAVDAATKLGNIERNSDHIAQGGPGAVAMCVGRNISQNPEQMRQMFSEVDMLVDAAQRRDPSKPIVPNAWIAWLPKHAVVVDLSVDPYTLSSDPPVVRGIEGIPMGSLNKYIFDPQDPDWMKTIPDSVDTQNRRVTTTCYSWPGIHPEACMRHYAQQMLPLMEALAEKGYDGLSAKGGFFERALHRASLHEWLRVSQIS